MKTPAIVALLLALAALTGFASAMDVAHGSVTKEAGKVYLESPVKIVLQGETGPEGQNPDRVIVKYFTTDGVGHESGSSTLTRVCEGKYLMNVPFDATNIKVAVSDTSGANKLQAE